MEAQQIQKKLNANIMLKWLNIGSIILEIIVFVYFVILGKLNSAEVAYVSAAHGFSLIWSILYHLFPALQTSTVYKYIAHAASATVFATFVVNVALLAIATDGWGRLIYLVTLLFFTGPGAFVAITLMILMTYDTAESQIIRPIYYPQIVYVPVNNFAMNSFDKML